MIQQEEGPPGKMNPPTTGGSGSGDTASDLLHPTRRFERQRAVLHSNLGRRPSFRG